MTTDVFPVIVFDDYYRPRYLMPFFSSDMSDEQERYNKKVRFIIERENEVARKPLSGYWQ